MKGVKRVYKSPRKSRPSVRHSNRTCDCGECKKCKNREAVKRYWERWGKNGRW